MFIKNDLRWNYKVINIDYKLREVYIKSKKTKIKILLFFHFMHYSPWDTAYFNCHFLKKLVKNTKRR